MPFGFLSCFATMLNLERMLAREVVAGDAFILDFENIYRNLNAIAPIIQKLKDKGYKWSYWFSNGTSRETIKNTIKTLTGDWTEWEHIDASKLGSWHCKVDVAIINWPLDFSSQIAAQILKD